MQNENQKKFLWLWWIVAIFLVVAITAIAIQCVSYFRARQERPTSVPQEQTAPSTKPHADRLYVYAGNPCLMPSFQGQINIMTNIGYVVGYCEQRKAPVWVGYRLFKVSNLQAPKRPEQFTVDARTSARVASTDYTGSGYDRGHMAPNYAIAICYGQAAQLETFLMSNIIPQNPRLNRGIWKNLEQLEIRNYAQNLEEIWILTGGIFEGTNRLASGVAIPSSCYKILVDEEKGKPRVLAFIMGQNVNGAEDFGNYLTSVDMIEQRAGLDFLADLPDDVENRLEAEVAGRVW
jgi:endonuclease G, mitochondrial